MTWIDIALGLAVMIALPMILRWAYAIIYVTIALLVISLPLTKDGWLLRQQRKFVAEWRALDG